MKKFQHFLLIGLPVLAALCLTLIGPGCRMTQPLRPISPNQFRSGELSRLGNAAMEKGNWDEAEKKLEEAVRLNKKNIELRRHYAESLWKQGKHAESIAQLAEAVRRGGEDDVLLHLSLSEKHFALNDPATAYRHAEEAIRLAPKEAKAWRLRGMSNRRFAEIQLRQADPVQPTSQDTEQYRRYVLQARNDYYRALSLSPNNAEIMPELASIQLLCGQPEQALATWQSFQCTCPPDAITDMFLGKAESYIALHRLEEAIECLNQAKKHDPSRPEIGQRLYEVVALNRSGTLH